MAFVFADTFLPDATGHYILMSEARVGPAGLAAAKCRRTDAASGLAPGVAALGAMYLGGVRFHTLADARQVHARCSPRCGLHFAPQTSDSRSTREVHLVQIMDGAVLIIPSSRTTEYCDGSSETGRDYCYTSRYSAPTLSD